MFESVSYIPSVYFCESETLALLILRKKFFVKIRVQGLLLGWLSGIKPMHSGHMSAFILTVWAPRGTSAVKCVSSLCAKEGVLVFCSGTVS